MAKPTNKQCSICAMTDFKREERPQCYRTDGTCKRRRYHYRHRNENKARMLTAYRLKHGLTLHGVKLCPTCSEAITRKLKGKAQGV